MSSCKDVDGGPQSESISHWGYVANKELKVVCPVALKVAQQVAERAKIGLEKYGKTMRRDDYDLAKMLKMAVEELLDGAVYLTRAIELLEEENV